MSEEKAIAFHKLVAEMRTNQREFWKTRDKDLLKKSIELEKRVDEIILHADGNDVPEDENGSFFLEVAQLRARAPGSTSSLRKYRGLINRRSMTSTMPSRSQRAR